MNIRNVNPEDAAQIAEIYNYYIKNTHQTFETETRRRSPKFIITTLKTRTRLLKPSL
jgi:L-amino acid N-acyltransferase YncA